MPAIDVPIFGNIALCLVLVSAAYTFAMALGAARGRPQLLLAARRGTYATVAFIVVAVCLLAYAFQTHDFRIRYVARYSDRSMPWWYLITSLWGGQDGSLLWWTFLLGGYTFAVTRWLRDRYVELQPGIYATLMGIIGFFITLQLFSANPFATTLSTAPADGEGLNPLLQNYWMVIHPPMLYLGFVGWSVPFAFVVSALITGRLNEEWIRGAHLWAMVAWTFLSIGLLLGCLWSYEELGWGGYWAWDPVENASFMPWLIGTAYLHSAIVQERYGMLKVWNVFLMCLTYFMTIFGTFLTRSGMIASVHAFARSSIGNYFVAFMVVLVVVCGGLIFYRLPRLRAKHKIHSLLSREFMFLLNNWILLGMMIFVLVATTWPLISEFFRGEEATVGPGFYNNWMVPFGLILLLLTGVGPLVAWRKATGKNLRKAMAVPAAVAAIVMVLHVSVGESLGFPPILEREELYNTTVGNILETLRTFSALFSSGICAFVVAAISQEFWRGAKVRMKKGESFFTALVRLTSRARRRYGGYIVHIGVVLMYFGFTGAAYDHENEAALHPGASFDVGEYSFRYERPSMRSDPNKRMVFTELTVLEDGEEIGTVTPAKFVYRTHPEMPTTEVAIRSNPVEDLYVIMSTVDPRSRRATFRVIVRPLVAWIWIGGIVLVLGSLIAMWPKARNILSAARRRDRRKKKESDKRASAAVAMLLALVASLFAPVGTAFAQSSSAHAGSVVLNGSEERHLFGRTLCMCGDCERLALDSCGCSWAVDRRAELRLQMENGATVEELLANYRAEYGAAAISIPSDEGFDRALWAVPVALFCIAAFFVVRTGKRWQESGAEGDESAVVEGGDEASAEEEGGDDYNDAIDEALARMEDDE